MGKHMGIAGKDWQIPVAITSSDVLTDWGRPRQQQDQHLGQQNQRQKQKWQQSSLNCLRQHFAFKHGYNTSQSS